MFEREQLRREIKEMKLRQEEQRIINDQEKELCCLRHKNRALRDKLNSLENQLQN